MATEPVVPPSPDGDTSPQERGKGRERGRGRGRGRGRRDRDIVTSASVFSMGPAEKLMQKRGGPEKSKDFIISMNHPLLFVESMGGTFGSFSRSERSERSESSAKT